MIYEFLHRSAVDLITSTPIEGLVRFEIWKNLKEKQPLFALLQQSRRASRVPTAQLVLFRIGCILEGDNHAIRNSMALGSAGLSTGPLVYHHTSVETGGPRLE